MTQPKPQAVRPPKTFDLAKFETMVEPFTVRVEKVKGSMKHEIPLPEQEGSAPGTGWTKDQVRDLQTWIVNSWAGGGHYQFAITDASSPPQLMEWMAYYPIHEYPERVPPPLQGAYLPNVPTPSNPSQVKPHMASFSGSGGSLPAGTLFPQVMQPGPMPAMPAPTPYYGGAFMPPQPYGYPPPTPIQGSGGGSEVAMLRDALARTEREAQQRDFERRLAESKAESDRSMQALQASMQAMVQQLTQTMQQTLAQVARPAVDPAVEAARAEKHALEQRLADMERARREDAIREEIRRTQEQTAKLVEESNRRFEAFMAANANKGPDPQFMMFQQMFGTQMEAMKEMARSSQSQLDRVQNFMMRPQDVLALAKEGGANTDQALHNMARQYDSLFQMSRMLTEQAAQMNSGGGGNEVIGLVRDVGANLAEMAKKYTGDKSKEAVAQMNAQAEIARAQAEVQKSQLDGMARMAAVEAAMKNGATVAVPGGGYVGVGGTPQHAMSASAGPNGDTRVGQTSSARPWVPPKAPRVDAAPAPSSGLNGAPAPANNVVPIKPADGEPRRFKGRTDLEWFGPILGNVNQLRAEVDKFIKALGESPPRKDGMDPSEAASTIEQAAAEIMSRQLMIPAMVELLMQGMVPDFLDLLLPDAPQAYRDDVVKILMNEETEDEDDEDEDDAQAS